MEGTRRRKGRREEWMKTRKKRENEMKKGTNGREGRKGRRLETEE